MSFWDKSITFLPELQTRLVQSSPVQCWSANDHLMTCSMIAYWSSFFLAHFISYLVSPEIALELYLVKSPVNNVSVGTADLGQLIANKHWPALHCESKPSTSASIRGGPVLINQHWGHSGCGGSGLLGHSNDQGWF